MSSKGLRTALRAPASRFGLIALLVFLPGFWWGAPRAFDDQSIRSWGVDDEAPIGPLAQVHNIIEPKEVQNLGYPLMHSFMVTAAYAPYLGALWVMGDFRSPTGEYPYGLTNPVRSLKVMTWLAHLLSVLLGVGIVVAAYVTAQTLWGEQEAVWAGVFTVLSYPIIYYSRTGNVDGPALFFIAAGLAAFAAILRGGITVRRTAWLGLWVGFACATKEQSAASFLGVPAVLLWLAWRDRTDDASRRSRLGLDSSHLWALGAGLLACVLAFGLGSGLFVDPGRYFAHLEFNRERIELLRSGEIAFMTYYAGDLAGNVTLFRLLGGYLANAVTYPGLVLAGIGMVTALRTRAAAAWFIVPLVTYMLVLFLVTRNGQLRYVMPASLVLGLFAARGIVIGLGTQSTLRSATAVAAGWIVFAGALRATDLTYQMVRDSRYDATAWLEERLEPGDRLDFFGPDAKLPWMPEGVELERANEYRGAVFAPKRDAEAARRIRTRWALQRPDVILIMPDVSSRDGEPHNFTLPPEIYSELMAGSLGYELAEMFHTEPLFPWLPTPELDYPSMNPPIRVFVPRGSRRSSAVGGRAPAQ